VRLNTSELAKNITSIPMYNAACVMLTSEEFETQPPGVQQEDAAKESEQSSSTKKAESSPVRATNVQMRKPPTPLRKFSSQSSNDADSSPDTSEGAESPSAKPSKWDYRKKFHELQMKIEDQDYVISKLTNRVIETEAELEKKSSELLTSLLAVEEAEVLIKQLRHKVEELENLRKTL
jgi:hypothetical protein